MFQASVRICGHHAPGQELPAPLHHHCPWHDPQPVGLEAQDAEVRRRRGDPAGHDAGVVAHRRWTVREPGASPPHSTSSESSHAAAQSTVHVSWLGCQYVNETSGFVARWSALGERGEVAIHPVSVPRSHSQIGCNTRVQGRPPASTVAAVARDSVGHLDEGGCDSGDVVHWRHAMAGRQKPRR